MSTALSAPDQRYEAVLKKLSVQGKQIEGANLKRYLAIGNVFKEYCAGVDANKYGSRTVSTLAKDIEERGILPGIQDTQRFLYWAKNITDAYTEEQIDNLVEAGFTVTHAKLLFALDDEQRKEVESKMVEDEKIISTRQLDELIMSVTRSKITARTKEALEEHRDETAIKVEVEPTEAEPVVCVDKVEAPAKEEAKAERPARAVTGAAGAKEKEVPPLRKLDDLEKALTRASSVIPDVFIILRTVSKRGFDSDKATQAYKSRVEQTKTAIKDLIEPLQEVLKTISETGAA